MFDSHERGCSFYLRRLHLWLFHHTFSQNMTCIKEKREVRDSSCRLPRSSSLLESEVGSNSVWRTTDFCNQTFQLGRAWEPHLVPTLDKLSYSKNERDSKSLSNSIKRTSTMVLGNSASSTTTMCKKLTSLLLPYPQWHVHSPLAHQEESPASHCGQTVYWAIDVETH